MMAHNDWPIVFDFPVQGLRISLVRESQFESVRLYAQHNTDHAQEKS
jgi:hypothetical protein